MFFIIHIPNVSREQWRCLNTYSNWILNIRPYYRINTWCFVIKLFFHKQSHLLICISPIGCRDKVWGLAPIRFPALRYPNNIRNCMHVRAKSPKRSISIHWPRHWITQETRLCVCRDQDPMHMAMTTLAMLVGYCLTRTITIRRTNYTAS